MPVAGGCLTGKITKRCFAVLSQCCGCFCWLLLLFVTFFISRKFCKLLFTGLGVRFVTFCYFFSGCNFEQLLFTTAGGAWFILYSLCDGGKGVGWFFFFFFLILEREGVEVNVFFCLHLTCGRRKGKGFFFFFNFVFSLWSG
jgi:hypothetical protein